MMFIRKYVAAVLIGCMLMSCSASTHLGVVTVATPAMTELNAERWFLFYQDQLDVYNGTIDAPTNAYPHQAHEGFQRALREWENKKMELDKAQTTLAIIGIGILIGVAVFLVSEAMNPDIDLDGLKLDF